MLDLWLILHFLGVALGVGTGFAMMTLGLSTRDMPPEDRGAFMRRASVIGLNGSIGLALLIGSGVGLLFTRGVDVVMAWDVVPHQADARRDFHRRLRLLAGAGPPVEVGGGRRGSGEDSGRQPNHVGAGRVDRDLCRAGVSLTRKPEVQKNREVGK
jgi:hypothetical protein